MQDEKECSKCLVTKPNTEEFFPKLKHAKCGLEATCKKCRSEYQKAHYQKNKAHRYQYAQTYYKAHTQEIKERTAKYAKENKLVKNTSKQRRIAKMRNLPYDFTTEQWLTCLLHFDNTCAYCGADDVLLCQDHVVPVTADGGYTVSNILPACTSCNTSKNDSDFLIWFRSRSFYSVEREQQIKQYLGPL